MNTINIINEGFKNRYLKESANPYGGDRKNFYMFYIGPTSGSVSRKDVIDFAKKHRCDSIYWASDDATGYKASYNGDTLVVFNKKDINRMPDDYKQDAKKYGRIINESLLSALKESWSGRYSPSYLSKQLGIDKDEAKRFSDYLFENSYDSGFTYMREAEDYGLLDDWYEKFKKKSITVEPKEDAPILKGFLYYDDAINYLESKGVNCDHSDGYGDYACYLLNHHVSFDANNNAMFSKKALNTMVKKFNKAKANHRYDDLEEEEDIIESFSR